MNCPNCNQPIANTDKHCPSCGNNVEAVQPQNVEPQQTYTQPQNVEPQQTYTQPQNFEPQQQYTQPQQQYTQPQQQYTQPQQTYVQPQQTYVQPKNPNEVSNVAALVVAIASLVLCGNLLFGILGIVFAVKVNTLNTLGDFEGASAANKKSLILSLVGVGLTILSIIIFFVGIGILGTSTISSSYYY